MSEPETPRRVVLKTDASSVNAPACPSCTALKSELTSTEIRRENAARAYIDAANERDSLRQQLAQAQQELDFALTRERCHQSTLSVVVPELVAQRERADLAESRISALTQEPTELQIAERIARQAHEGQQDTVTGAPYITHVERVVSIVAGGEQEQAAAWLHDVLEDSDFTASELGRAGISEAVLEAVGLLTRHNSLLYAPYIDRLQRSGNRIALAVKLADLSDHLHANCPERLRPRYEAAWKTLTGFDYVRPEAARDTRTEPAT